MSDPDTPRLPLGRLSFVIPCFNEAEGLPELLRRLGDLSAELLTKGLIAAPPLLVLVDDGSTDATWEIIEKAAQAPESEAGARTPRVRGVRLSRNHGHQAALLAGLLSAPGDVLISMDADLQDDPAAIPRMIEAHGRGAEIVFGVRSSRQADTAFKRRSARMYYETLRSMGVDIVADHADYRLMSRRAIETLRRYDEVNLFLRGIVRQIGFDTEIVEYERPERFAGESKYPLGKMLALALDGVTSFSIRPLRYATWIGLAAAGMSFVMVLYSVVGWAMGRTVEGWASIVVAVFMLGGFQLIALGIIGEYVGKIYLETKRRPRFIVDEIVGPDPEDGP